MKKMIAILPAILILLLLGLSQVAWAESEPGYVQMSDESESYLLTPEELDDLLAPIALYPDPMIAQILPAATFAEQIQEAADFVRRYGKTTRLDDQPWDVSVKAVAHYPDVLYMMADKYDWTVSLGQAFIDQQQEVMDSVQRLRAEARAQGNLYSTAEQQVIVEDDAIRIVPASPQYVYVPVYDPQLVYVESYNPVYPLITFGVGLGIGAWLSRDFDWRGHRVYYHGWRGRDWVNRSRPHIHDRRGIYINRRASVVHVNDRVRLHDTRRFRQELRTDALRRREHRGVTPPPARPNRPGPGRIDQQRPGRIEQRGPGRIEQPRPGRSDQQRRPDQQTPPGAGQRRPADAGQQGQQRQPGTRGESGRGNRPGTRGIPAPAATTPPAATVPSPAAVAPPAATAQPPAATGRSGRHSGGSGRSPAAAGGVPSRGDRPPAATAPQGRPDTAPQRQPANRGRSEARPGTWDQLQRPSGNRTPGAATPAPRPVVAPATPRPQPQPSARPVVVPAPRPTVAPAPRPTAAPAAAPRPAREMREHPSEPRSEDPSDERPASSGRQQRGERR